ncbi:MAG: PD-(D/E)XK nuclease family protein [Anaerolineaceae bacterium]
MPLPPDFIFSQNNLQTFVDCPRRFELAFLLHTRWPAVQAEPVVEHERHLQMGARFHQLVFQHIQGLPAKVLSASITDPETLGWWQNYLSFAPAGLPDWQEAEYELSIPFAGYRLMARYDLLSVEQGHRVVIIDWKTTLKKTSSKVLAARVQTRLYPFILANSALLMEDTPIDQISMLYWFPNFPGEPISFVYSPAKLEEDRRFFNNLIETIAKTPEGGFALTSDTRACRFCRYRSLCGRGDEAGQLAEIEDDVDDGGSLFAGIDLDQIAGIAF